MDRYCSTALWGSTPWCGTSPPIARYSNCLESSDMMPIVTCSLKIGPVVGRRCRGRRSEWISLAGKRVSLHPASIARQFGDPDVSDYLLECLVEKTSSRRSSLVFSGSSDVLYIGFFDLAQTSPVT